MPVQKESTNPEYVGPDRVTFISAVDPTAEELKSIPVGVDMIVAMPNGLLSEWYWAQELADDMIAHAKEHGPMMGHVLIYVNPEILKEGV